MTAAHHDTGGAEAQLEQPAMILLDDARRFAAAAVLLAFAAGLIFGAAVMVGALS